MSTMAEEIIPALGLALLHFIWQGALLAAGLAVALCLMRGRPAADRYLARVAVLTAMAACPVLTVLVLLHDDPEPVLRAAPLTMALPDAPASAPTGIAAFLPWIVGAWSLGAALLLGRLGLGWLGVHRLRRCAGTDLPAPWHELFVDLARRMGVRAQARLVRDAVRVPTALGWLQPLVLLPAEVLTGLSEAQIRALLAHELAHVRRADYLVNILQSIVEALLFYHPAVWIVSRGIRAERECCCDEMAVALTGDRLAYARTLADLAALRIATPQLELSTLGGSLMYRIKRLLGDPSLPEGRAVPAAGFLVLAGSLTVASLGLADPSAAAACPPEEDERKQVTTDVLLEIEDEEGASTYELHRLNAAGRPEALNELFVVDAHEERDEETVVVLRRAAGNGDGCCCCCCKGAGGHARSGAHGPQHDVLLRWSGAGPHVLGQPGQGPHVIWLEKDGTRNTWVPGPAGAKPGNVFFRAGGGPHVITGPDGDGHVVVVRPKSDGKSARRYKAIIELEEGGQPRVFRFPGGEGEGKTFEAIIELDDGMKWRHRHEGDDDEDDDGAFDFDFDFDFEKLDLDETDLGEWKLHLEQLAPKLKELQRQLHDQHGAADIEKHMQHLHGALEHVDIEDLQKQIHSAMEHVDFEELQKQIHGAMEQVDVEDLQKQIHGAMEHVDFEELQKQIHGAMEQVDIEELHERIRGHRLEVGEMEERIHKALKDVDVDRIQEHVRDAMKHVDIEEIKRQAMDAKKRAQRDRARLRVHEAAPERGTLRRRPHREAPGEEREIRRRAGRDGGELDGRLEQLERRLAELREQLKKALDDD